MPSPTSHIFHKEIREMIRDKRVLTSAFVGPVFLIVIMLVLFGFLQDSLSKPKTQTIHVVSRAKDNPLIKGLEMSPGLKIVFVGSAREGEKLVRDGKAKVVLKTWTRPPRSPAVRSARLRSLPLSTPTSPLPASRPKWFRRKSEN